MASFRMKQDMPPPGGYGPVDWAKKIQKRGLGGYRMFGLFFAGTGLAWFGQHFIKQHRRNELLEMNDARIALEPFMIAERKRMFLRQLRHNRDEERELMKDVEGWEVGKYKGEPVYWNQANRFHQVAPEEYWMHNDWWDMYNRLYEKLEH